MDNSYFDEIHQSGKSKKNLLIKTSMVFGCILVCFLLFALVPPSFAQISFLLIAGAIVATVYGFKMFSIEYEYIFTNGEMDFDAIKGQTKRKRLLTVSPKEVELFLKYTPEDVKKFSDSSIVKTMDFSDGIPEKMYFMIVNVNCTKMLVLFSPSQRLIESLTPFLKKASFNKALYN